MSELATWELADEIAIIGLAGRFPGAQDLDTFWRNLKAGVESIEFSSKAELAAAGIPPALLEHPDYVRADALLKDVELFDAEFFGYTPRQAEIMDPQQRLFLEVAWEALEQAGYSAQTYTGQISVYGGAGVSSYFLYNLLSNPHLIQLMGISQIRHSNRPDNLATRVAYKLNLCGPAITVQTGYSTSLVAIHLACQSLLDRESDLALAGGVNISSAQKTGYLYQSGGIASPDGHCRAFDANAQGTISGNGVGIVVLKRLADAIADRDYIHALIKGSAINNDGAVKVGYTAPSQEGQAQAITEAMAMAQVTPDQLSYIETHGTGTILGDPIEVAALNQACQSQTDKKGFCGIGSVKTNIGHLDTAAGVAGLIKTVLALQHQQIPASLHFEQPNPQIDFANSPFYVNAQLTDWPTNGTPRLAGVSSFGIGGTNAHVILSEAPPRTQSGPSRPWQILPLSARTPAALETVTTNLINHYQNHPDLNLADIAYTLQIGRQGFNHRRVLICPYQIDSTPNANINLNALPPQQILAQYQEPCHRSIVFMFPGQGCQHVNMARELYQTEPIFRQQVDQCCELLQPHLKVDLRQILYPGWDTDIRIDQTAYAQPALFVIAYALAQLWMSWGIQPTAMIGHSIGEYVAACLAGVFSLADALKLVAIRGQLMQQQPTGTMVSVSLPATEVTSRLTPNLSLAASNAPALCVVSGPTSAVTNWQEQLVAEGIGCRSLHTSHAFHSQMMAPTLEPFMAVISSVQLHPPKISLISNVTGGWMTASEATDPGYWVKHLRETVCFAEGMTELLKTPDQIFLEVGPGSTLSTLTQKQTNRQHLVLSSLPHPQAPQPQLAHLLTTLSRLWLAGVAVDWSGFYAHEQRCRLPLPTYPFERKRYWIEPSVDGREGFDFAQPSETELRLHSAERDGEQEIEDRRQEIGDQAAARNSTEMAIAQLWQDVLGLENVGIFDNFFELGGDSVLAIQIITLASKMGLHFTPPQLFEHQTIAELAAVATSQPEAEAPPGSVTGQIPLTPTQHRFFEQNLSQPQLWHQAILLEIRQLLDVNLLEQTIQCWLAHHDVLRLRFVRYESGWQQFSTEPNERVPFRVLDLSTLPSDQQAAAMTQAVTDLRTSLNLTEGPLLQVAYFDLGIDQSNRLLLVVHDLVIDAHSWGVLLADFWIIYQQLNQGSHVHLLRKTTAFKQWADYLHQYAQSTELTQERAYWIELLQKPLTRLPIDHPNGCNTEASVDVVSTHLNAEATQALLQKVLPDYGIGLNHGVLMVLVQTVAAWAGGRSLLIDIEHPGRIPIQNMDLSQTVGCCSHSFPALFTLTNAMQPAEMLKAIKQELNSIPSYGLGYGIWRYLSDDPTITSLRPLPRELNFVYLDESANTSSVVNSPQVNSPQVNSPQPPAWLGQMQTFADSSRFPQALRPYLLEVRGAMNGVHQLCLDWHYSRNIHHRSTIQMLAQQTISALEALITEAQSQPTFSYTPSDFTAANLSPKDLNQLLTQFSQSQQPAVQ
ncbi:MAG: acyltransferase domain-containing protein [Cyanothece sp. SIO1E1]|nr:acyltransferase domain-containing protein [Cyanothece sp. SIO1E1]